MPKEYWTEERIIELIEEVFPEDTRTAIAIAKCESGLKQWNEYGDVIESHTSDTGLYQINWVHDTRLAALGLDKTNIVDNITFARMLYENRGWKDWVCKDLI